MKILSYSVVVGSLVTLNIVGWRQYCIESLTNDLGGIDVDNNKFILNWPPLIHLLTFEKHYGRCASKSS